MTIYVFYNNDPLAADQGGGAEHIRGIYRFLTAEKLEFEFVCSRKQDTETHSSIKYISKGANIIRYFSMLFFWFWKNRKKFSENDVFHFHRTYVAWPKFLIIGCLGRTIITYHNLTGKVLEDWVGKRLAVPIRKVMIWSERKIIGLADVIIFVSERVRQQLRPIVLRENFGKSLVIPAAFDQRKFSDCRIAPKETAKNILCLGRLEPIKNFGLAIEVINRLSSIDPGYSLTIAGDGSAKNALLSLIKSKGCQEHVKLAGLVPHDDIPELMKQNGIILVTSHHEASPTVVKEALASKRHVVTTDVGDVNEWITDGSDGFICANDPRSISEAIMITSKRILDGEYCSNSKLDLRDEASIMENLKGVYCPF